MGETSAEHAVNVHECDSILCWTENYIDSQLGILCWSNVVICLLLPSGDCP